MSPVKQTVKLALIVSGVVVRLIGGSHNTALRTETL